MATGHPTVQEFIDGLNPEAAGVVTAYCNEHHIDIAFGPVISLVEMGLASWQPEVFKRYPSAPTEAVLKIASEIYERRQRFAAYLACDHTGPFRNLSSDTQRLIKRYANAVAQVAMYSGEPSVPEDCKRLEAEAAEALGKRLRQFEVWLQIARAEARVRAQNMECEADLTGLVV